MATTSIAQRNRAGNPQLTLVRGELASLRAVLRRLDRWIVNEVLIGPDMWALWTEISEHLDAIEYTLLTPPRRV